MLLGFKLKDFLHDNETLSEFLEKNATLPKHAVRQIVEANVNLEKVNATFVSCLESTDFFHDFMLSVLLVSFLGTFA